MRKLLPLGLLIGFGAVSLGLLPYLTQTAVHRAAVRALADSVRAETCRGGTLSASGLSCSGGRLSPRVTYLRRFANRIDSIELAAPEPAPVESVQVVESSRVRTYYTSTVWGFPVEGVDTVTVCAVVHYPNHDEKVGWRPVRIRVIGDSAVMGLRGGNPMEQMCGPALRNILTVADSTPVVWEMQWFTVNGRRIYRPVAGVP